MSRYSRREAPRLGRAEPGRGASPSLFIGLTARQWRPSIYVVNGLSGLLRPWSASIRAVCHILWGIRLRRVAHVGTMNWLRLRWAITSPAAGTTSNDFTWNSQRYTFDAHSTFMGLLWERIFFINNIPWGDPKLPILLNCSFILYSQRAQENNLFWNEVRVARTRSNIETLSLQSIYMKMLQKLCRVWRPNFHNKSTSDRQTR